MGIIELVVSLLIWLLVLGVLYALVVWVCGLVGIPLPMQAIKLVFAILGLIVFLLLIKSLIGGGAPILPKLLFTGLPWMG